MDQKILFSPTGCGKSLHLQNYVSATASVVKLVISGSSVTNALELTAFMSRIDTPVDRLYKRLTDFVKRSLNFEPEAA